MLQTTHDISVIICAYTEKRWDDLLAAVESVRHQTLPATEIIIVVDYNSAMLSRIQENLSGVIAIENQNAKGASGARNTGAAIAQGTILAFLDDDAIAQPDWLENLAACYTDTNTVGVGGKIEPLWSGKSPSWFPEEFFWVVGCTYRGMPTENAPVRNVIGANMSVRKEILMVVGGFRESFGNNKETSKALGRLRWFRHHAGDEETELCIRITQHVQASQWLYAISAVVQHHVPAQRTRWRYFVWRCYDEGLGKAGLVKLLGRQTGLSSEMTYTLKVLPRGFLRGLTDVFLNRSMAGFTRAAAITIGLTATTIGYLVGTIMQQATLHKELVQTQTVMSNINSPA
jgi:glucosyl-dolichyl phosphate glucuronosyltransferase